jgi:two-component system response regulator PilR (NtrC family)
LSARLGVAAPDISLEARAALQHYSFPGNVRELENILERAIALSAPGVIALQDLQLRPTVASAADAETSKVPVAEVAVPSNVETVPALGDQLEHLEREAIIKALEQTRYNKTAAARLLGMSFRALRYRVKKLGIE